MESQPLNKLLARLWRHISPRRRLQFGLLLVLMVMASFAEALSIGAILPFIGALMEPQRIFSHPAAQPVVRLLGLTTPDSVLLPFTIAFAAAAVAAAALRLTMLWSSLRISFAVGTDLSMDIYRRTLYQPYAVHVSRNSSEILNGVTVKNSEVIFYIIVPVLALTSSFLVLSAIIASLLAFIPFKALAALGAFGVLYALIIRLTRTRLKTASQQIAHESTNVIKFLQEGLGGIRDVLLDGSQETFCAIYRAADKTLRRAQSNNQFISQSPRYGMEALAIVLISTLAYLLTRQAGGISQSMPVLAALALGIQRLLPNLQQAYGAWTTISGAHASLQDVLGLLDQPMPEYAGHEAPAPMKFERDIRLRNLAFRYAPEAPTVLQHIDLTVSKGSRIGFVGTTGCGKSTLLDIVMGLLPPTDGTIEIDGIPVTPQTLRSWQRHVAHVPQTIFLTDSSIEENIAFGVPVELIDRERVRLAARQAQLAEIIDSWPRGYQTEVGERGVQLSGGQRQRIGIARALYKQADVLIFDEFTSALDDETEQAVMEAIDSLSSDLTILIIAHRRSTLEKCTEIYELVNGTILNKTEAGDQAVRGMAPGAPSKDHQKND